MPRQKEQWGFYGGNVVEFDGRGFSIKMAYGSPIYLEYNEAQALASLLYRIIFKNKANKNNGKEKTKETPKVK